MSLKAKLEAVIYAAEEPVTLAQLAQLFAADALEWQAARIAASQEANAEVIGESPAATEAIPLIVEGLESVPMADTAAMAAQTAQQAANAPLADTVGGDAERETGGPNSESSAVEPPVGEEISAPGEPVDAEAEARRLGRQRDREIKSILKQILDEIIAGYEADDRGVEIREIAGGYRMATKPECHDAVRLFVKSLKPPLKLSLPALETLAVVAYKQPVTAPEVSEIRGVESGGVLGSLLARKLIATAGRKQVIGRPILYKTTKEFLLRFGLKDVAELPSMEEFEKMAAAEIEEEMEPEAVAADAAQAAMEAAEAAEPLDEAETGATGEAEAATSPESSAAKAAQEASEESSIAEDTQTDATSGPSNEQDAVNLESSEAPPAGQESLAPAETEASPHAEEVEEEHRA